MAEKFDLFGLISGASFAAGIAVLVVIAARLILKKAPKRWSYIMWAVVFFRCLCPFAAESSVSIFNALNFAGTALTSETAETDVTANSPDVFVSEAAPATDGGYVPYAPSEMVQPPASEEYIVNTESVWRDSYEPVQNDIQNVYNNQDIQNVDEKQSEQAEQSIAKNGTDSRTIFIIVWLCGVGAMALYGIVSAARLAARVKTAVRTEKGIYESDRISTAFAAGLLSPKIYIPCGIPEDERRLIVMHERVHIRRRDYLFKLLAFAGLSLHWFNPLIWAAFALMTRDMEMSCDEAVLRECGESGRILYAEALLRVSVRGFGGAAVVGFGETGIKKRVKNVLNYKKPGKLAAVAAAMVMLASCTMAGTDAVTDNADTANGANAANSANATAAHSGTMLEKGTTELSGSGGERFFFAYAEKLGETVYWKTLPQSEKAGMPAIVFPDGSAGGVGFYEGDKPKLSASAEFRSDNNGSLSSCMSELTIGLDPEDTEEITVKGLKKVYKDELAFIEVDMDIRLKENAEPPQGFLEMSGRGEFSSDFKDGVCSIKAAMEVSQNYFAHGITAEDLYGYGFVLCGFDNVPIYVSDGLEVVGRVDSSNFPAMFKEVSDMEDGEQLEQKQRETERQFAEQELRLQEELRKLREEEERQRRLMEEAANAEKFSYPFSQFPVSAADLGEYGANEWHVLFAVPKGTEVLAAEDGTVKSAKKEFNSGYGFCMEISHDDEMSTFYAHLDKFAVKVGDKVKKGDVIAYSGSSGDTVGDALLFEIRRDGIAEDPRNYYSFSEDGFRRALEEIGKNYVGDGIRGIYDENGTPLYEKEQETIEIGSETYYLISTEEQLRAIAAGEYGMDKNFLQKSTIQLSSDEWIPIGTKEKPFTGSYNGNGFEIIGLTITDPNATRIGMFGWTENANIYNITLRDYDIESAGRNAKRISVAPIVPVVTNGTRCYDNHVYPAESPKSASVLAKPCPQEVKISALYGKDNENSVFNKGIDYMAAKGTEVYAAADGKVLVSEDQNNGYGITVIIDHGGELATIYAHLDEALVGKGDEVKAGDLIGYSGHTGFAYGDTLHFEVRENGQHVDPMNYLKI